MGVTVKSCCLSVCEDSQCPGCSRDKCLSDSVCRAWSCGTFDEEGGEEVDCLFWISSGCSPEQPLGSVCTEPDGSSSMSYCEVMPPLGQRPSWALNRTRICARNREGRGRCKGAKQKTSELLIKRMVNLLKDPDEKPGVQT